MLPDHAFLASRLLKNHGSSHLVLLVESNQQASEWLRAAFL
jgi:hypothetical protein